MAYQIYNISGCSPDEHPLYFLDANVWLAVLKHTGNRALETYEQEYVNFFEAIITCHNHPAPLRKKLKNVPRLVMTSLLLSEIINAYMRKVAMVAFFKARGDSAKEYDFKRDYRPIPDYEIRLRSIVTDIQAFNDYISFEDDHFNTLNPIELLTELSQQPTKLDLNDLYFGKLARLKDWAFVTHDSDCQFEEVSILTANDKLLRKKKSLFTT